MLSRAKLERLIDIVGWSNPVLTIAGIGIAFWMVATRGLGVWTALVMAAMAAVGGVAASLTILLEERLARRIREQTGRAPDATVAGAYSPNGRLLLIGVSLALFNFGFMCIAPAVVVGIVCGVFGGSSSQGIGRCFGHWTNTTTWILLVTGVASLVLWNVICDPKKLGLERVFRLRRNAERRKARREKREERDRVADLYAEIKEEQEKRKPPSDL